MARRKKAEGGADRVRNLIALDAANLIRRLEARREEMLALFSRLRSREPMLSTLATRFDSVTFPDLVQLPVREQAVVNRFYERLGELRWYLTWTEDMPGAVRKTIDGLYPCWWSRRGWAPGPAEGGGGGASSPPDWARQVRRGGPGRGRERRGGG